MNIDTFEDAFEYISDEIYNNIVNALNKIYTFNDIELAPLSHIPECNNILTYACRKLRDGEDYGNYEEENINPRYVRYFLYLRTTLPEILAAKQFLYKLLILTNNVNEKADVFKYTLVFIDEGCDLKEYKSFLRGAKAFYNDIREFELHKRRNYMKRLMSKPTSNLSDKDLLQREIESTKSFFNGLVTKFDDSIYNELAYKYINDIEIMCYDVKNNVLKTIVYAQE